MIEELLLEEERKIQEADISRLIYEIQDARKEVELLESVGFQSVSAGIGYRLFAQKDTYSLLINDRVIQGKAGYVLDRFSSSKWYSVGYPSLYSQLLEIVRTEGVS